MEHRTQKQEMRYTMALGYAWGRKDAAAYGSESGRKAMTTSALDFAAWYAATTGDWGNIESVWDGFSALSPTMQRKLAEDAKTLPYIERYHA